MSNIAGKKKEMKPAELAALFSNLKLIYHSGISLNEGLEILVKNTDTVETKDHLITIKKSCSEGVALSKSLEKTGKIPHYAISLITIAHETGKMDVTMENLQKYYEKRDALSQNIRSATIYPLSMLLMVFLVVIALLTKALPVFEQVFSQLGFSMTGLAGGLYEIGTVLNQYSLILISILAYLVIMCFLMRITPQGRSIAGKLFETSVFTKKLAEKLSLQRFALAMSGMLNSGIEWDQAIELAEPLMTNNHVGTQVKDIRDKMKKGASFHSALENSGLFPGRTMALLAMGIQTGTASDAFQMIGESIAAETEKRIDRLVATIEPAMVCIMCVLVGVVLLSVMLPIMGILTNM